MSRSGITSLAGLEQLKGLTTLTLDLSYSEITSLAGLERLKGLTTLTLNLSRSGITSLAGRRRGSIQSGLAPVRAGGRHAASIIS